jgi:hypothetical protein
VFDGQRVAQRGVVGVLAGGHIDGPPGTSATVHDAVQDAAMDASSPARYPDEPVTRRLALSADARSESITSEIGGGGGGGPAGAAGLGLGLVVSLDDEVSLPAVREISVDSARACAARWVATTVSAAAICGGLPTAAAAAPASALSFLAWSNGPNSSSTGGGLGGDSPQADATTPSTARAAPPASRPRLLVTGTPLGTATSCHRSAGLRGWAGRKDVGHFAITP